MEEKGKFGINFDSCSDSHPHITYHIAFHVYIYLVSLDSTSTSVSTMNSTVISIPSEGEVSPTNTKRTRFSMSSLLPSIEKYDTRQLTHSIKVGIALVLVSLLYLVDSLYAKVGENAMWAIMTVVVIFEFSAGGVPSVY